MVRSATCLLRHNGVAPFAKEEDIRKIMEHFYWIYREFSFRRRHAILGSTLLLALSAFDQNSFAADDDSAPAVQDISGACSEPSYRLRDLQVKRISIAHQESIGEINGLLEVGFLTDPAN